MPSKHTVPVLGWRPASARDVEWLRARAAREGRGAIGRMLDEALAAYREQQEEAIPDAPDASVTHKAGKPRFI